jgi:hypothetical protein
MLLHLCHHFNAHRAGGLYFEIYFEDCLENNFENYFENYFFATYFLISREIAM